RLSQHARRAARVARARDRSPPAPPVDPLRDRRPLGPAPRSAGFRGRLRPRPLPRGFMARARARKLTIADTPDSDDAFYHFALENSRLRRVSTPHATPGTLPGDRSAISVRTGDHTPSAFCNRAICSAIGRGGFGVFCPLRPCSFSQTTTGPAP